MAIASKATLCVTGSNVANPGNNLNEADANWINPENIELEDSNYARSNAGNNKDTDYLTATGFGGIVPDGATITGVTIQVNRNASTTGAEDEDVDILLDGVPGTNLASGGSWSTSNETVSYGGASNLGGHAEILTSDLDDMAIRLSVYRLSGDSSCFVDVYWIKVTIHFTLAGLGDELIWLCPTLDEPGYQTNTLIDLTDSGYDGTLTNMESGDWAADTDSGGIRCLELDGVDEYIAVGDIPALEINGDVTISLWARAASFNATNPETLIGYANAGVTSNDNTFYGLWFFNPFSNLAVWIHEYGTKVGEVGGFASPTLSTGTWYHVLMARNDTTKEVKYYLNGVLEGTFSYTNSAVGGSASTLDIGRLPGANDYCFDGRLDDIRIYDRVLDSDEMDHLSTSRGILGAPATPSSLAVISQHYRKLRS